MRNIFLEISKCGGDTIAGPFSTNPKLSISLDQQSKAGYTLFLSYAQVEHYRNISKLSCRLLAFTLFKAFFKKTRRKLELVSLSHFLHDFWRKIIYLLSDCPYFLRYWAVRVLQLFVSQFFKLWLYTNFETNHIFLINPFFYMTKNSRQKFQYLENKKSF